MNRKVNADKAFVVQAARERDVSIPRGATLENHAQRYADAEVFPNDGGLTEQALTYSINAARDTGFISQTVPNNQAADLSIQEDSLRQLPPR
jgi:hypothetical protein